MKPVQFNMTIMWVREDKCMRGLTVHVSKGPAVKYQKTLEFLIEACSH